MKYKIYKSNVESVLKDLEALEGVFVFPSIGYEIGKEDSSKFSIECILISYYANNNKPFGASFLNHLSRFDEYTFYAILETDELINAKKYLFNWNGIPGEDSNRLIRFLKDDIKINWVENAEIIKTKDNKTIRIFSEEKSVEIALDENNENAMIKICDGLAYNIEVKDENGKLNIYKKDRISSSTYIVNFIASLNYIPFFISNKNFLIYDAEGEPFEDSRYGDLDRFVGNGQFNPFLILLGKFEYKDIGKAKSQNKKFENAVIALRWAINCGFPYKKIINWEKNEIIDENVRKKVMTDDIPFDTNFIEGNREYRFCRLIRFGLKEIMLAKRNLFEKLLQLNLIDPVSSLYFFEIIKKPITNVYIPNVQLSSNFFKHISYEKLQKPSIFSPAFIISMRIYQPKEFTEKFLKEKEKHPTILGGMKWDIKPARTLAEGKQRYLIEIYAGNRVNILDLSEVLSDIRKLLIRLLINSGLDEKYLTNTDTQFWLRYLEITIPIINEKIITACVDMLNKEFGLEQKQSAKYRRMHNPTENELLFRLGFGYFSNLMGITINRLPANKVSSDRLDRCDPFTKAAVTHALSGNYIKGEKLLNEIIGLFDVDRSLDMPYRFYYFILNNEKDLIPYLTKKHPMSFMSDENYKILKNDVKFFIINYHMFKNLEEPVDEAIVAYKDHLFSKLKFLGIYKDMDLSHLDNICKNISLFFSAQCRKEFCK